MPTEAEIRASIAKLETELAHANDTVQFQDRMVRKRTASDIQRQIEYFKQQLAATTGGRSRQMRIRAESGF